ncbi:MAG: translation initiation factor IF-2 [Candidatus Omnitrophica bacterium]|nr:translation initiation factor IF-2 [Candidatus Omnitrophota bacterium]
MKVSELAKELEITSDAVLKALRSLKLKAKDSEQELSAAVVSVIKSELKTEKKTAAAKSGTAARKAAKSEGSEQKVVKKKEFNEPVTTRKPIKTEVVPETKSKKAKEIKKEAVAEKEKAVAPRTKKVISKPVRTSEKGKAVKKKTIIQQAPVKETAKPHPKISKAPVITLKPLVRKHKKPVPTAKGETGASVIEKKDELKETRPLAGMEELVQPSITPVAETVKAVSRDESLPDIEVQVPITVKDLSVKLQEKPSIVLKHLMKMGVLCHINQALDSDIVSHIVRDFGFNLTKIRTQEEQVIEAHKKEEEDESLLKPRAPVVTFMGHVDHGKTTLLDQIRKSKVADQEHGGITQHIGAYSVFVPKGRITFLDTPGHEAFTAMRARGAHITDIVVLVVAADEGIMPQTLEAIDHARAANVPIVVALTKIDKKNAEPDRVKKQLSEHNLMAEDWGGKTVVAGVSGVTGEGVDQLLEMILLEAEMLELKANDQKKASGIVVEAHLSHGKGAVTTLIIQSGTLHEGDIVVLGPLYGKIRAVFDDHGRPIKSAGPSMPVEILGLSSVPEAGELFYTVENEKQAKEITQRRQDLVKNKKMRAMPRITLEDLHSQLQEGAIKELNVILKSDVQGSLEALKDSLEKIPSDKVKVKFIHLAVGDVNASDVLLAVASNAIIIAFHVSVDPRAKEEIEKTFVDVREYRIIYDAVNDMKKALEGLLEAKIKKHFLSRVEIREVFKLSKQGTVAGCYVQKGKVNRKAKLDVVRDGEIIFSGSIGSLKRFKDDVRDVSEGMECGITINGFDKYQQGDIIEVYETESIAQTL